MNKEFEDKTREELEELVKYYRSEHVIICGYWKNEIEEHKKTKNYLNFYKERSELYRRKLDDLREHFKESKTTDYERQKRVAVRKILDDLDEMKKEKNNDVCV